MVAGPLGAFLDPWLNRTRERGLVSLETSQET